MKAITIYQPWATLWALQESAKRFETRSWFTNYRGLFAIHAAKKKPSANFSGMDINDVIEIGRALGIVLPDDNESVHIRDLIKAIDTVTTGAVIATGELIGCHLIDRIQEFSSAPWEYGYWANDIWHKVSTREMMFGNWRAGRYAWELANVEILQKAIPANGRQGLWEWRPV